MAALTMAFQSAPLLRGAIEQCRRSRDDRKFQSAPLLRGAIWKNTSSGPSRWFQSAPLLRGAMNLRVGAVHVDLVSIRAPLARGDAKSQPACWMPCCFNPRPSCEGRLTFSSANGRTVEFQSAPLLRGAIILDGKIYIHSTVSIRAPLARGDTRQHRRGQARRGFNPRPSCEGRS